MNRAAVFLFLALAAVYCLSTGGHTYSGDEEALLITSNSLLHGTVDIKLTHPEDLFVTPSVYGRHKALVGIGGLGQSVVAIPLRLVGSVVAQLFSSRESELVVRKFILFTNPLITAATAVIVLFLARELGASVRASTIVALSYGLGTMAWEHAKTFFSEPGTACFLAASVLLAIRSARHGSAPLSLLSGAALGVAVQFRPSAALFPPIIVAYLVAKTYRSRRRSLQMVISFGAGLTPWVVVLLATNWWRYSGPFDLARDIPLDFPVLSGLGGFFFSPGKSLFLYAPIVVVSVLGLPKAFRKWPAESGLLLALSMANLVFFARFPLWHGDHAWGPRFVQIVLPLLVALAAPVADQWRRSVRIASVAGFLTAGLLGVAIYFNQYFHYVDKQVGHENDRYHVAIRNEAAWNPLIGHARLLPEAIRNTVDRLDGDDASLRLRPFPDRRYDRFYWYWDPPQIDTWWVWIPAEGGQRGLWVLVPPLIGVACWSAMKLRGALAALDRAPSVETARM